MLYLTNVKGETQEVTDWKSYDDTIMSMSFQINEKQRIVMKGFSEYIRLKEEVKGVLNQINHTSKVLLLGRAWGEVAVITIDLIHGDITQEIKKNSNAYNNKPLNSVYWKKGVLCNPKIFVQEV